jgi:multisubunit Na+/H+ antiporter MnhF subunit
VEKLFGIAEKIATPLSLAALALLVLYAVYKLIFGRLQLERVVGKDVYRLTSRAMTFLFVLGLILAVLAISSYIIGLYLNGARAEKATLLLKDLGSDSAIVRLASIYGLVELAGLTKAVDTGMCVSIRPRP